MLFKNLKSIRIPGPRVLVDLLYFSSSGKPIFRYYKYISFNRGKRIKLKGMFKISVVRRMLKLHSYRHVSWGKSIVKYKFMASDYVYDKLPSRYLSLRYLKSAIRIRNCAQGKSLGNVLLRNS